MCLRAVSFSLLFSLCSFAQQTAQITTAPTQVTVPHLIRISGQMQANGTVGVTFALYKSQNDSAPLWTETQNIKLDVSGKYTAVVGVTKAEGIPLELFASGEAQWLGIRREGQAEQPRILLVSVPYAMKAAEAETLAGHTASEFVTQENLGEMVQLKLQEPEIRTVLANPFVTATTPVTEGATNFTDSTTNQIMLVTQNGTGKLIVGEGPSHIQVFSVDQTGVVHGTGLALDGSAGRTIGMGNNATSGGAGYQLVVRAGEAASGSTNKRGGELQLAAGPGTGTGGSGDVVIQTATGGTSGTAVNTLISRHVYASSQLSMGGQAGSLPIAGLQIPLNESGAMEIDFKIYATDGTSHEVAAYGRCIGVTIPTSSTTSYENIEFADYMETGDGSVNGGCFFSHDQNTGAWVLTAADDLSFLPTLHTVMYELRNFSQFPLLLYANQSSAEKGLMPTMAAGPMATREHPHVSYRRDANGTITVLGDPGKR